MGILIATSVLSFLLVSSGLGSISWQLLKERDSQNSAESDPQYHLQDNGIHVQEVEYPTSTGEYMSCAMLNTAPADRTPLNLVLKPCLHFLTIMNDV